jgi:uncharacterized protein (TIGR03067 family)
VPEEELKNTHIEITSDKIRYVKSERLLEKSYTLDPTKSPKWLDVTQALSRLRGAGIYELSGDELKISINEGKKDDPRADGFEWKPMSPNDEIMVLKRRVP